MIFVQLMKYFILFKMILIRYMGMRECFCFCLLMNLVFFFSISLVIIGGDGSVINVINALLRYLAKENRTK